MKPVVSIENETSKKVRLNNQQTDQTMDKPALLLDHKTRDNFLVLGGKTLCVTTGLEVMSTSRPIDLTKRKAMPKINAKNHKMVRARTFL